MLNEIIQNLQKTVVRFQVSILVYNIFNDKLRVLITYSIKAGWYNIF